MDVIIRIQLLKKKRNIRTWPNAKYRYSVQL